MDYSIEKNLIQGLRNREADAFEHLRKTCFESVAFIAASASGSEEDARDLYSEGVVCLLETLDKPDLEMKCTVRTMLFKICTNRYNVIRKKERARWNFLNRKQDETYEENFEEILDRKVYRSIFWQSFKKLKEDCQKLIKRVLENLPQTRIAGEMGITPGSLKNKKKNCLVALINIINEHPDYAKMVLNNEIVLD